MELKTILVVNVGSSSCKGGLFEKNKKTPLWQAHLSWKELPHAILACGSNEKKAIEIDSIEDGVQKMLKTMHPTQTFDAIGHRIVHGGDLFQEAVWLTPAIKKKIQQVSSLAPLHNQANLEGIDAMERLFPKTPQYVVFDSAFHSTLPESAYLYGLPFEWRKKGIRRYGFHGISFQYCSKSAASFLKRDLKSLKMLICHLGAGASLCALKEGKSIDTTMGMTPLEGLVMASRSGTIDPGIIFHLLKHEKMTPEELEIILNKKSGLLGLSGLSEDMRDIIEAASQKKPRAQAALGVFIHRLQSLIGSMIASLGGLDVIVFTGGIGEHIPLIREEAAAPFAFLGLALDPDKNRSSSTSEREISSSLSSITALVIPTQEEWEIACIGHALVTQVV